MISFFFFLFFFSSPFSQETEVGTVKQARYSDSTSKIHVVSSGESDTMKVTPSEPKASVVVNKEALNQYFDKQLEVHFIYFLLLFISFHFF